jgi:hypothetical protein
MRFGASTDLRAGSNSESAMRQVGSAVVALSGPLLAMNCGIGDDEWGGGGGNVFGSAR